MIVLASLCGACRREPEAIQHGVFQGISFVDQNGAPVEVSALSEQALVVSFMFTSCPVVCPRHTKGLVETRAALPAAVRDRIRFVSVSVDPDNDTPQALKAFAQAHGADEPGWSFVRADAASTQRLTARLAAFEPGVAPTPSAHGTTLYLFDRGGRLVQRYRGAPLDVSHLARELVALDELKPSGARLASN